MRKIVTDQRDDYIIICLLDYNYFNKFYKIIAIDLFKKQGLESAFFFLIPKKKSNKTN